jgi:CBS domain-containing protein
VTAVRERMSTNVTPIPIDATLVEAARQTRASGAGGLPVLAPDGGRCAGIVTERDVVVRALAELRDARAAIVRDVATLKPVTCAPEDELSTAVELMRQHEIQRLPVVDNGEVVGVVSLADIAFGRPDEERAGFDPERSVE